MVGRPNRLAALIAILALVLIAACNQEVTKEVPLGSTPAARPSATVAARASTVVSEGDKVYHLGIFEDLTTTNYWSYLGSSADGTVWNAYVLGDAQPSLFGYSDQRFDWIPSLADGFPTPIKEETIGGRTLWTTEVDLKQGFQWTDGAEVTAEDFVFTMHTVLDLQLGANWTGSVDPDFVDHAEALDTYKLKVFFKKKPGLSIWQFGAAFMPVLSRAYWEPVVVEAKRQGDITDQQKALFAHVPENQPSAGGFAFKKWERGAFAETVKNPDYFLAEGQ